MSSDVATIQLFAHGTWIDAAVVSPRGDRSLGIATPTVAAYTTEYAVDNMGRRDAAAVSWGMQVGLDTFRRQRWPAFLVDLLPQGHGRHELLRELGLPEGTGPAADWDLLLAGAGNSIGHLRVKEAHDWLVGRARSRPRRGFTVEEVAARGDDFTEFLASRGLFVAGSSGVQGEWPKLLLTEARDGLLHLDHELADADATRHWLVKFGRGRNEALAQILRLEAPYLRIAKALGLRVHGEPMLRDRALFIPRFDRALRPNGVERIAQESLASLCGIAEFGAAPVHNLAVAQLARAVSAPETEVAEYVKRDIANVLLGNKDNHARNTAIQRFSDGVIRLSPVFDFAPMFLHPDGLARRMRWERDDAGAPRWASVVAQCREATGLPLPGLPDQLRQMSPLVEQMPGIAVAEGVDASVVERLRSGADEIARQLRSL